MTLFVLVLCGCFFNGEIHCVQELGCHLAQSNQLNRRLNKQLPKDVITAQRCFHMDSTTPQRSASHCSAGHGRPVSLSEPCAAVLAAPLNSKHSVSNGTAATYIVKYSKVRSFLQYMYCVECVMPLQDGVVTRFFRVFRCAEASPNRLSSMTSY